MACNLNIATGTVCFLVSLMHMQGFCIHMGTSMRKLMSCLYGGAGQLPKALRCVLRAQEAGPIRPWLQLYGPVMKINPVHPPEHLCCTAGEGRRTPVRATSMEMTSSSRASKMRENTSSMPERPAGHARHEQRAVTSLKTTFSGCHLSSVCPVGGRSRDRLSVDSHTRV